MALTKLQHQDIGSALYAALRTGTTLPPLTDSYASIEIEDGYHISRAMLACRMADNNETVVGKKIGATSDVVQKMLGVFQPDFGFLTNTMAYGNGADIPVAGNLIQPRAEGEIAFILKQDLRGTNITEEDVLRATDFITPCFEVVDSRIHDWNIKIQDTVADNASCGVYVLGNERIDPNGLNLAALEIEVFKNGQPLSRGFGSAVQGNPLTAVVWLANTLGAFDIPLLAGEVILSGSVVPLEPVVAGDRMSLNLTGEGLTTSTVSCQFF
jgi:2-oxopent-4-enoate/cis-2-oxohex-4-enoate hydratase